MEGKALPGAGGWGEGAAGCIVEPGSLLRARSTRLRSQASSQFPAFRPQVPEQACCPGRSDSSSAREVLPRQLGSASSPEFLGQQDLCLHETDTAQLPRRRPAHPPQSACMAHGPSPCSKGTLWAHSPEGLQSLSSVPLKGATMPQSQSNDKCRWLRTESQEKQHFQEEEQ